MTDAVSGCFEGWVVQSTYAGKVTTAVISLSLLEDNEIPLSQMLKQTTGYQTGLGPFLVKPEDAVNWRLSMGDRVGFEPYMVGTVPHARIVDVWNITSPEVAKQRPWYSKIMRGNDVVYPGHPVTFTRPSLYTTQLMVPIGLGMQLMVSGEPGAGKSSLLLEIEDALLEWAGLNMALNPVFVFWHLGERGVDRNTIEPILAKHRAANPALEVYHFGPPRGVAGKFENLHIAEFVKGLIERLFENGNNVFSCGDGLRGLVNDTYAKFAPQGYGLSGSGVSTYGIEQAVRFVAHAGYTPRRSITNIVTTLGGFRGQAEQIRIEVGQPEATGELTVAKLNGGVGYPKFLPHLCSVRQPDLLFAGHPKRLELHRLLRDALQARFKYDQRTGDVVNARDVLLFLQEFAATGKPWDESVELWHRALTTIKVAAAKYENKLWQEFVNASGSLASSPDHIRRAAMTQLASMLSLKVQILEDDEEQKPEYAPAFDESPVELNATVATRALVVLAGAAQPDQNLVAEFMELSRRLQAGGLKHFGHETAENFAAAGFTVAEVEPRLRRGESPKRILSEGRPKGK